VSKAYTENWLKVAVFWDLRSTVYFWWNAARESTSPSRQSKRVRSQSTVPFPWLHCDIAEPSHVPASFLAVLDPASRCLFEVTPVWPLAHQRCVLLLRLLWSAPVVVVVHRTPDFLIGWRLGDNGTWTSDWVLVWRATIACCLVPVRPASRQGKSTRSPANCSCLWTVRETERGRHTYCG